MSCDTFYIVISPSSPCPGEYIGVPCLTLQQYASDPSQIQNITLLVEPGVYNLSTVLTVSDGYNFTMSSTNATVTCTSATAKFEFNRVENVYISGMTFQGCRNGAAVQMSTVTRAIIMRSNFTENQGCLQASYTSITISECKYYNNIRGVISVSHSKVMINKSQFKHNTLPYDGLGGTIYAQYSNITIYSSEFCHNAAYRGGVIYTEYGRSELQINNAMIMRTELSIREVVEQYICLGIMLNFK